MSEGHETTNETKDMQIQSEDSELGCMVVACVCFYGSPCVCMAIFAQGDSRLRFDPSPLTGEAAQKLTIERSPVAR